MTTSKQYLGTFEQLVLLSLAGAGGEAEPMSVVDGIASATGRDASVSAVYVTLKRLEKKSLVASETRAGNEGGPQRKHYTLLPAGITELEKAKIQASMPRRDGEAPPASAVDNPRVSFGVIVEQIAMQAMSGLGQMDDPRTGRPHVDLELASDCIDMITLLDEKTAGNLTTEEKTALDDMMRQLRKAFDQVRAAYEAASQAAPGMPPGTPPETSSG